MVAGAGIFYNRVKKFLDYPPAIFPFLKKYLYLNKRADSYIPYYADYHFLPYADTIQHAIDNDLSLIRFGDELFDMIHGIGLYFNDWSQPYSASLKDKLITILKKPSKDILLCFNPEFLMKDRASFIVEGIGEQYHFWTNLKVYLKDYTDKTTTYGSALCFNPRYNKSLDLPLLREFFKTKHIIILSSQEKRFNGYDIGKTTSLISCPKSDSWGSYDVIKKQVLNTIASLPSQEQKKVLILASISTAGKVLVYELTCLGYQSWDTGQLFDLVSNTQL